jgi:hypothetical protein
LRWIEEGAHSWGSAAASCVRSGGPLAPAVVARLCEGAKDSRYAACRGTFIGARHVRPAAAAHGGKGVHRELAGLGTPYAAGALLFAARRVAISCVQRHFPRAEADSLLSPPGLHSLPARRLRRKNRHRRPALPCRWHPWLAPSPDLLLQWRPLPAPAPRRGPPWVS